MTQGENSGQNRIDELGARIEGMRRDRGIPAVDATQTMEPAQVDAGVTPIENFDDYDPDWSPEDREVDPSEQDDTLVIMPPKKDWPWAAKPLGILAGAGLLVTSGYFLHTNNSEKGGPKLRPLAKRGSPVNINGDLVGSTNPGFDFEPGTSCGPNKDRAAGRADYEANKGDITNHYQETRKAYYEANPGLAKALIDWMEKNAPWQLKNLEPRVSDDPVFLMKNWVDQMEVQESAETIDTNNFGCKNHGDGSWEVFDVPSNSKFEAPWAAGSPWIVVKDSEVRADGTAVITHRDGSKLELKAGEFIPVKTKSGAVKVGVSLYTCDNPQLPVGPVKHQVESTVPVTHLTTTSSTSHRVEVAPPAPAVIQGRGGGGEADKDNNGANNATTSTTTAPSTSTTYRSGGTTTTTERVQPTTTTTAIPG